MSTRCLPLSAAALLAVLLVACAASPPGNAQADTAAGSAAQIRALEQQQAKLAIDGNRAALEKIFAPEFRVINPAGAVVSKNELLDLLTRGGTSPYRSANYETQDVTVNGDTAWSVGLETVVFAVDMQGMRAGQTVQRRITHVWQKQSGQWRLVLRHATNVTPPR